VAYAKLFNPKCQFELCGKPVTSFSQLHQTKNIHTFSRFLSLLASFYEMPSVFHLQKLCLNIIQQEKSWKKNKLKQNYSKPLKKDFKK